MKRPRLFITRKDVKPNSSMVITDIRGNSKSANWQDFMEGKLHIDHIIPISAFNFTKPEHINFKRCWGLSNLRLLPAKENRIKKDKIIKPFQLALQI